MSIFAEMPKCNWMAENVALPELDYMLLERWLCAVAGSHGKTLGCLGYIFCDDAKILEVNREYLKHDYYTDIITFDYTSPRRIAGDMYISLDTVRTNADTFAAGDYGRELLRVIVHGVLHLCGINDKGPGEREVMCAHEEAALRLLDEMR